jgi:hypothetical protein
MIVALQCFMLCPCGCCWQPVPVVPAVLAVGQLAVPFSEGVQPEQLISFRSDLLRRLAELVPEEAGDQSETKETKDAKTAAPAPAKPSAGSSLLRGSAGVAAPAAAAAAAAADPRSLSADVDALCGVLRISLMATLRDEAGAREWPLRLSAGTIRQLWDLLDQDRVS